MEKPMASGNQFAFGAGFLNGIRNDLALLPQPRRFATLQEASLEFAGDIKPLFGQYSYAVDVARGKTKISGKAKFAGFQAQTFNDLFFGQTVAFGQDKIATPPGELFTIASGSVSYTVANSAGFLADRGVFYGSGGGTGDQLTAVGSGSTAISAYSYVAATGVYTFSSADIGN